MIDELTKRSNLVLAGGGVVTQLPNRNALHPAGHCGLFIYLPVEVQLQRTYRDKNRPLLQVETLKSGYRTC